MDKYIIVGRKVDGGGTKFLHNDGSVTTDPAKAGAAGRALDVEFIGKTVVELSRRGPLDENSLEYQKVAEVLRQAMAILPMDSTHDLNDPEIERIHDNIQVKLVWDQRVKKTDEADANTRTLVVPVQDTLAEREDYFSTQINQPGFEPPLTYTLDQLMIKHFFDRILDEAMNEAQTAGTDLPDAAKQAIKTRVNAQWSQKTSIFEDLGSEDEEEDPTRKSMARILTSPVSAFHRAVGIYITNMCD